jgi:hypothetical protein
MQIKRTVSILGAILAVAVITIVSIGLLAPPDVLAQTGPSRTFSSRVGDLEGGGATNKTILLPNSQTTAQIDWNVGASFVWTNLATNVTLQVTNVIPGKNVEVWADGDGTARNITLSTNGSTGLLFVYDLTPATNGSPSFICTNYSRIILRPYKSLAGTTISVSYMTK